MVVPVLRAVDSPDIDDPMRWEPTDDLWSVYLELSIGTDGQPGEELFGITVCSPSWLAKLAQERGAVSLRHHVVMEAYRWPVLEDLIAEQLRASEAPTWQGMADQFGRFAHSEFEDYEPT
jgi:hypothetical protein